MKLVNGVAVLLFAGSLLLADEPVKQSDQQPTRPSQQGNLASVSPGARLSKSQAAVRATWIQEAYQEDLQHWSSLKAELKSAVSDSSALDVVRRMEGLKMGAERKVLQAQLESAQSQGRIELARKVTARLEATDSLKRRPIPAPAQRPTANSDRQK